MGRVHRVALPHHVVRIHVVRTRKERYGGHRKAGVVAVGEISRHGRRIGIQGNDLPRDVPLLPRTLARIVELHDAVVDILVTVAAQEQPQPVAVGEERRAAAVDDGPRLRRSAVRRSGRGPPRAARSPIVGLGDGEYHSLALSGAGGLLPGATARKQRCPEHICHRDRYGPHPALFHKSFVLISASRAPHRPPGSTVPPHREGISRIGLVFLSTDVFPDAGPPVRFLAAETARRISFYRIEGPEAPLSCARAGHPAGLCGRCGRRKEKNGAGRIPPAPVELHLSTANRIPRVTRSPYRRRRPLPSRLRSRSRSKASYR